MAWAIYSTPEDLQEILSGLNTAGMTGAERTAVRRFINGALENWENQPMIPTAHPCYESDGQTMRTIVVQNGSLAEFRARLADLIQKYPERAILRTYYDLSGNGWYAVDPYPAPEGYFALMTCT